MNRRRLIKSALSASALALTSPAAQAAPTGEPSVPKGGTGHVPRFGDGRDWFFEKRFGMFVHWGIYALPGWHEQHQWRGRVDRKEYGKFTSQWNPVKFDPNQWLDLLEEAGMRYLTVTTKHHDGFCLFESKLTDFHTVNTPYKKDIIGMLAEACHKRKIPLCLYYSIADWHHPNYPNLGRHHELPAPLPGDTPDWEKYMEYLKGQVRELCTNYGEIHGIWWDMNVPKYKDPSVNAMIRQLQPNAVINDRGFDPGDFGTPERDYGKDDARAFTTRVEACQAVGQESWGYRKDEDYFTAGHLIRSIDRYLARDGNFLLNVGPQADGTINQPSAAVLREIGAWMRATGEAHFGTLPATHLTANPDVLLTRRGKTLYVHLNPAPITNAVKLKPFTTLPKSAVLLNDGKDYPVADTLCPIDHGSRTGYLRIRELPAEQLLDTVGVLKLEFDEDPESLAKHAPPASQDGIQIR